MVDSTRNLENYQIENSIEIFPASIRYEERNMATQGYPNYSNKTIQ